MNFKNFLMYFFIHRPLRSRHRVRRGSLFYNFSLRGRKVINPSPSGSFFLFVMD
ncbi:hypothetical protein D1AOALGA4SA_7597 [Olavius algarvensis Delta 1 endosymbiont]|nr:hypothetical protein D1AOALGA4SA_7597 [Olavius algarvensis Delta 1 endosymbiont]